jgi:hypothetical protein
MISEVTVASFWNSRTNNVLPVDELGCSDAPRTQKSFCYCGLYLVDLSGALKLICVQTLLSPISAQVLCYKSVYINVFVNSGWSSDHWLLWQGETLSIPSFVFLRVIPDLSHLQPYKYISQISTSRIGHWSMRSKVLNLKMSEQHMMAASLWNPLLSCGNHFFKPWLQGF